MGHPNKPPKYRGKSLPPEKMNLKQLEAYIQYGNDYMEWCCQEDGRVNSYDRMGKELDPYVAELKLRLEQKLNSQVERKWWVEHGNIDIYFDFHYCDVSPEPVGGIIYGPFDSFLQAKAELISKFRDDIGEIRKVIKAADDVRQSHIFQRNAKTVKSAKKEKQNARHVAFSNLKNHPHYANLLKRLSKKDLDDCETFMSEHADASKDDFAHEANRWMLDKVKDKKGKARLSIKIELLSAANSNANPTA